jgi:asparagine synthase (glutamine-hydrolysing)
MATYFVSTLARDHGVKVVLSGDGGDELFAGYHKWMQYLKLYHRLWRFYASLPRAVRQLNYSLYGSILRDSRIQGLLKTASCGEELFQGGTAFKRSELEILLTSDFQDDQMHQPAYTAIEDLRDRYDRAAQPESDYLNWMTYAALKTELLEDYLMRLDKMGMAASIEGREPFLDHEFVELALSIPPELKYRNYEQKSLLKKAAARLLPKELVYRRKQGFCAPLADWLLGNMKEYLEEALLSLTASHPEIFRKEGLRTLYGRFQLGQGNPEAFWSLINFALWHRRWIENSPVSSPD